ncbi:MAG: DNA polymerase III subunit delta [Saprospiraceae bacterium]|nr:MAG: DNA polymerase III subunit delta [Saprospiraceae bacterium]
MTLQQILAQLKKKEFAPIYFLHGSEPFFIDTISDYIEENALSESERSFNQIVLYGKDTGHLTVIDNARRYPMMSKYQVVIVKEAQQMEDLKELEQYLEKPLNSTILVLCHKHKKFNMNTKFGKLLAKQGVVFESNKLYDNQVPEWIKEQLKLQGHRIANDAADLMAEYLGTDLSVVMHELSKLTLHVEKGTEITTTHVEQFTGISREYNIFELQKALSTRDSAKTGRIIQNFLANPKRNPIIMVIGSLGIFFTKVYQLHFLINASDSEVQSALDMRSAWALREYRQAMRNYPLHKTESIIGMLKEYDLKAKGVEFNTVGKEEGELLKDMIYQILH